jgi:hypothetical protein
LTRWKLDWSRWQRSRCRNVSTIWGAFVQIPMTGKDVYMKIDPKIMKYVVELFPKLAGMVEHNRCLYTLLLKGMYGCIQASALWYALIPKLLEDFGYAMSKTDPCVFRKYRDGRLFLLLLYVDDILAVVDEKEEAVMKKMLKDLLGAVQFEGGNKLSYLGV